MSLSSPHPYPLPSTRRSGPLPLVSHRITIGLPSSTPLSPKTTAAHALPPALTRSPSYIRTALRRRPYLLLLALVALVLVLQTPTARLWTRDAGYVLRPLWDSPGAPFTIIPHYPVPAPVAPSHAGYTGLDPRTRAHWCALHGWSARPAGAAPVTVDTTLLSTELDFLEIRMREYAHFVSLFILIEADRDFSGAPKPLVFAEPATRERFERLAAAGGAEIVYVALTDLRPDLPRGSFVNEETTRRALGRAIAEQRQLGRIPDGALVLHSDIDEVVSASTLGLLATCEGFPADLHLNVDNYRYSFEFPLNDGGYWRPHVTTVQSDAEIRHTHGRVSDAMLAGAGWHCSFCFPTLEGIRRKMRGYAHNDRLRGAGSLGEDELRARVCQGRDPFDMWPEAFTFKDLVAQSGERVPSADLTRLPLAVAEDPDRFGYLLGDSCTRPDQWFA